MNHQIVDHVHVEAARRKDAQSVHFEKQRPVQDRLNRNHGRIETLDVAHLQDPSVFLCRVEQCICLHETNGHGFLDKHVETHFQKPAAHRCVGDRRDGHASGIRLSAQFIETFQDLRLKFSRNGRGTLLILVEDSNEFRAFEFPVHSRVVAPEFACTDNGNTNLLQLSRRRTHSLLIPSGASLGSGAASGGKA